MPEQSTRHIMMMEPVDFNSNPQTHATNQYQEPNPRDVASVREASIREFRNLRDTLVENGVIVTTVIGQAGCPDDIFCNNWVSTHDGARMVLYPMLAQNRRTERRPGIVSWLERTYDVALDLSAEEEKGRFLESTGALCMDRVNGVVYVALSPRADRELAEKWAAKMGYEAVFFNTRNHAGHPVYHTDVLQYIGSGYAGICSACIVPEDRDRVLKKLSRTHEIVDLSMDQLINFCGNALEVRGRGDEKLLAMSQAAHNAMTESQKKQILKYAVKIVSADVATIEKYGGGSARCMLLELH